MLARLLLQNQAAFMGVLQATGAHQSAQVALEVLLGMFLDLWLDRCCPRDLAAFLWQFSTASQQAQPPQHTAAHLALEVMWASSKISGWTSAAVGCDTLLCSALPSTLAPATRLCQPVWCTAAPLYCIFEPLQQTR